MKKFMLLATLLLSASICFSQAKTQPVVKDPAISISKTNLKKDSLDIFKLGAEVNSFDVSYQTKGKVITESCIGNKINGRVYEAIRKAPKGTTFYVEKIEEKKKDGSKGKVPSRIYRLVD